MGNSAKPFTRREDAGAFGFSVLELLMVVGLTTVIAAIAAPMMSNTLGDFRLRGDARSLTSAVSLAKLRAASYFSQSRVYVDLVARTFHIETWDKTAGNWATEGGSTNLSAYASFGFGVVGTAPAGTQAPIGQASPCVTNLGAAIANTACVLFNSRGIPVAPNGVPPNVGAPTGNDALYITDGSAVYTITVSATGQIRQWRTNPTAVPGWVLQ